MSVDTDTVALLARILPVTDAQLSHVEAMAPLEAFATGAALATERAIADRQRLREETLRALDAFINDLQGERQ